MKDFLELLPFTLDSQYGQAHNGSWNIAFDWEVIAWNAKSPLKNNKYKYVYCLPAGCEHVGVSSTWQPNFVDINATEISIDKQTEISECKSVNQLNTQYPLA